MTPQSIILDHPGFQLCVSKDNDWDVLFWIACLLQSEENSRPLFVKAVKICARAHILVG